MSRPFPRTIQITMDNYQDPLSTIDRGKYPKPQNRIEIDLVSIQPHSVGPEPVEIRIDGDSDASSRIEAIEVATVRGFDKDGNIYYIRFIIPETDKQAFIHWLSRGGRS